MRYAPGRTTLYLEWRFPEVEIEKRKPDSSLCLPLVCRPIPLNDLFN